MDDRGIVFRPSSIVYPDDEQATPAAQSSGDCAQCHAYARAIMAPWNWTRHASRSRSRPPASPRRPRQRARRKPLAEPTIASYCDAWRSFGAWAARQDKRAVAQIGVTDLARWIDSLSRKADGTALTYSHGALAICKFLADRGDLAC